MLKFKTPVVVQLQPGELMRCDQARRMTLQVVRGRVWLTQANDPDDHWLGAGQRAQLHASAQPIVGADGPAQVALARAPSWWQRLTQALVSGAARRAGRTIERWTCPHTS